jgi:arsenite methyltransferase
MAADVERLKSCCARFYEAPGLRSLLGGVFHPGGLRSTEQLGEWLGLGKGERVLDIACGPGRSAIHLARRFGCCVTGIDYSQRTVQEARADAGGRGQFIVGDAECLPFDGERFDAVVIECSLCLIPRKAIAVAEMRRVLKVGGRIGIADIALEQPLPAFARDLGAWVACLSGADTTEGYRRLLVEAGFADVALVDATWALTDAIGQVGRMLFLADVARGVGSLPAPAVTLAEVRGWLGEARRWITDGRARYVFFSGRRL